MKFNKSDVPLILNGFSVGYLLFNGPITVSDIVFFILAGITILWYGESMKSK